MSGSDVENRLVFYRFRYVYTTDKDEWWYRTYQQTVSGADQEIPLWKFRDEIERESGEKIGKTPHWALEVEQVTDPPVEWLQRELVQCERQESWSKLKGELLRALVKEKNVESA